MSSRVWTPLDDAQTYELCSPATFVNHDEENISNSYYRGNAYHEGSRRESIQASTRNILSVLPSSDMSPRPPLGKPAVKKRFHTMDLLAMILSFLCLTVALIVVADEKTSWHLGVGNHQLVILGFLLSIMNLCLGSVAPTLFLLVEVRFGPSTLQNYDGILRNKPLGSQLSMVWRFILALMLALPLALSAAYKIFTGGESAMNVNATMYVTDASHYGMFAPPGLQSLGEKTGISLFSNATLPFAVAASPQNGSDPPMPLQSFASGFNVLSLNNESTAMLDIPQPAYVSAVQKLLAGGESWNITAPVRATVATFNHSRTTNQTAYDSFLLDFCKAGQDSSGAYTHMSMMNNMSVALLDHASPGDQTLQYIALTQDPGIEYDVSCLNFSQSAKLYDLNRQMCKGTWSITRGGIQLVDGSCNGTILPAQQQLPITNNSLFLGVWYMSSLVELIGPFATERNKSVWETSYMATGMAAMVWSRITVLNSAENLVDQDPLPLHKPLWRMESGPDFTYEDVGLLYPVNDYVLYIRPTLRTSVWLYLVLAIQPLLIVITLGLALVFYSTPLDKGFGLISILSGINARSLDRLAGAALSGKLTRSVKLVIQTIQDDQKGAIKYHVDLPSVAPPNGKLASDVIYH